MVLKQINKILHTQNVGPNMKLNLLNLRKHRVPSLRLEISRKVSDNIVSVTLKELISDSNQSVGLSWN